MNAAIEVHILQLEFLLLETEQFLKGCQACEHTGSPNANGTGVGSALSLAGNSERSVEQSIGMKP